MTKTQLHEKLLPLAHHKETKYLMWYINIIEKANSENRKKLKKINEDYIYYENHHILPRSLFEEYIDLREHNWNSVLLTAKEHFIVHLCIWKHYKKLKYTKGEIKMSYAILMLNNRGEYNSKHYECLKLNLIQTDNHRKNARMARENSTAVKKAAKKAALTMNIKQRSGLTIREESEIKRQKTLILMYGSIMEEGGHRVKARAKTMETIGGDGLNTYQRQGLKISKSLEGKVAIINIKNLLKLRNVLQFDYDNCWYLRGITAKILKLFEKNGKYFTERMFLQQHFNLSDKECNGKVNLTLTGINIHYIPIEDVNMNFEYYNKIILR